jgi:hypothetical protein
MVVITGMRIQRRLAVVRFDAPVRVQYRDARVPRREADALRQQAVVGQSIDLSFHAGAHAYAVVLRAKSIM